MEKLRKEIIGRYNELLYSYILDEDINLYQVRDKKEALINVLRGMSKETDTGFESLDDMVKDIIRDLIDAVITDKFNIVFNYSGIKPEFERVTFKE